MSVNDNEEMVDLKKRVVTQYIIPELEEEVQSLMSSRRYWRAAGNVAEGSAQLLVAGATVVAFSAGVYKIPDLIFAAGAINIAGLAMNGLAKYAQNESSERNRILDRQLAYLGIAPLPDIAEPTSSNFDSPSSPVVVTTTTAVIDAKTPLVASPPK